MGMRRRSWLVVAVIAGSAVALALWPRPTATPGIDTAIVGQPIDVAAAPYRIVVDGGVDSRGALPDWPQARRSRAVRLSPTLARDALAFAEGTLLDVALFAEVHWQVTVAVVQRAGDQVVITARDAADDRMVTIIASPQRCAVRAERLRDGALRWLVVPDGDAHRAIEIDRAAEAEAREAAEAVADADAVEHRHDHEHGPAVDDAGQPLVGTLGGPEATIADLPPTRLKRELDALPAPARERAQEKLRELAVPMVDIVCLHVDQRGMLYYRCNLHDHESAQEAAPEPVTAAILPISTPPVYHSRPGSTNKVFLDFNGGAVSDTAWNDDADAPATWQAKPYSTDGDEAFFSDAELEDIRIVWARVAEDFAPFNIDVTTEAIGLGPADDRHGHVLITETTDANGVAMPHAGAAGIAYLSVFGQSYYEDYRPAFMNEGSTLQFLALGIAHEFGHNLGLSHDATVGSSTGYYAGHGTGETSWAPIMGSSSSRFMDTWSKGEYFNASNTQDDLAIIAALLGYRSSDHGDTTGTASVLTLVGTTVGDGGRIERTEDRDAFTFSCGAGAVSLTCQPLDIPGHSRNGGNLDVRLEVRSSAGALVASADPAATVAATLVGTLPASDTYTLLVIPTGVGAPLSSPPSGYTVYGSLGVYELSGTIPAANAAPVVDAGPPQTIALPSGATLNGSRSDDGNPSVPGTTTVAWSQDSGPGAAVFANATNEDTTVTFPVHGVYVLRLTADDGAVTGSDTVTISVHGLDANGADPVMAPGSFVLHGSVSAGTTSLTVGGIAATISGTGFSVSLPPPTTTTTYQVIAVSPAGTTTHEIVVSPVAGGGG